MANKRPSFNSCARLETIPTSPPPPPLAHSSSLPGGGRTGERRTDEGRRLTTTTNAADKKRSDVRGEKSHFEREKVCALLFHVALLAICSLFHCRVIIVVEKSKVGSSSLSKLTWL